MYLEFYDEECYYCKEKDNQCMKTLDQKFICPICLVMEPLIQIKEQENKK
jgi:hypothetical protein